MRVARNRTFDASLEGHAHRYSLPVEVVLVDDVRDYTAYYAPCLYRQLAGFGYSAETKGLHLFHVHRDAQAPLGVKPTFRSFSSDFFGTVATRRGDLPEDKRDARVAQISLRRRRRRRRNRRNAVGAVALTETAVEVQDFSAARHAARRARAHDARRGESRPRAGGRRPTSPSRCPSTTSMRGRSTPRT